MQIKKVGGEVVYTGELPSSEGVTLTLDPGKYEVKSVFKTIFGDEYSSDATNFTILDYTYDFITSLPYTKNEVLLRSIGLKFSEITNQSSPSFSDKAVSVLRNNDLFSITK